MSHPNTVISLSQAVSGEITLEKLIQMLMRIAVEYAGAERALLVLSQRDVQQIEAEVSTGLDGVRVLFARRTLSSLDLPESILTYVMRSQECVLLDDASSSDLFSSDDYIAQKQVRSILCLPLVKHSSVIGALYLENVTTPRAFSPARVEVLKLLVSQVAISLENARLHTDLQKSDDALRLAIDTIPALVWSCSPDGSADFINRRWTEYTGVPVEELLGNGYYCLIHPDDIAGKITLRRESFTAGIPYAHESRIRGKDGEYRRFLSQASPLRDESGEIVKWYEISTDIEDRKQAEEALQTAFEEIRELKNQLRRENVLLKEEVRRSSKFEEIIGSSRSLARVLNRLAKVAPTDSTVLIMGETGTGKELIARSIHKASRRSERAFVSINCAAIPHSLIASELFGHEKGAFTDALQLRLGRFELADGGTIFLDEVGELPLETQVALLRVLQEREYERVGGNKLIRSDVRVITATNRNLQEAVAVGTFRRDLFYRINVFPIEVPPLRERKDDIPMLVEYFINCFAKKTGKKIRKMKKSTLDRLQSYSWPGNLRELQNVIERSLIISDAEEFTVDEVWLNDGTDSLSKLQDPCEPSFAVNSGEKEMIESALVESKGRIAGPSGAAARLNMPPSTLNYKIRNLRINKSLFKDLEL